MGQRCSLPFCSQGRWLLERLLPTPWVAEVAGAVVRGGGGGGNWQSGAAPAYEGSYANPAGTTPPVTHTRKRVPSQ